MMAMNQLLAKHGKPRVIMADKESALIKIANNAVHIENGHLLRKQGISIQVVTAHTHWPRGLGESHCKAIGKLDHENTKTSAI